MILPSMAEHVLSICKPAIGSGYEGVGHMPFWEAAERFYRGTRELVDRVSSDVTPAAASRPGP